MSSAALPTAAAPAAAAPAAAPPADAAPAADAPVEGELPVGDDLPKSFSLVPPVANPLIPRLQDLCVDTIIKNFDQCADLDRIATKYRTKILQTLPVTLPLSLAIMALPDGIYWKRRTLETFPNITHEPSRKIWKRFFLENYASKKLEDATETTVDDVFNDLRIAGPYIRELKLTRSPCKVSILKLFKTFRSLKTLSLVYGEPRRSFAQYEEFDSFDIRAENSATLRDCQVMCQDFLALGQFCSLEELDMSDNSLNEQSFLRVAKGLFTSGIALRALTFSHNEIGDEGAKAIASCLLNSPIRKLNLADNRIAYDGIERLCACAEKSQTIEILDLSSNRIGDQGIEYIANLIEHTKSLQILNIAGNRISQFATVCQALPKNATLKEFIVAANPITDEDYASLQAIASQSQTLDKIDLRVYQLKPEDFDVSTTETSEAPLLRFK
jgi:Ran GTPase-activating protein (RanGAP) involved in mRNA processing and transport